MTSAIAESPGIEQLYQAWSAAMRGGDAAGVLALLTDDYVLWPSSGDPQTRVTIAPRLTAALAAYDVASSFECEERIVSGNVAFERGWDVQTVRPRAGGEIVTQRQRVFLLLRRGEDGRWRFARGMSNMPAPT